MCEQQQLHECAKAVFGEGEFELVDAYKHLEVPHSMWIGMSPEQRKQSVDKVNKITFGQKIASPSTAMSISTKQLSVKLEDAKVCHVHIERLQNMWQKAEELLSTPGFVVPAAGNIEMCRQVASLSNKGKKNSPPHFVSCEVCKVGTEVKCDCPVYRSTPNTCQHALAVAEDLNLINEYLRWIQQTKKPSNLSLLIADVPPPPHNVVIAYKERRWYRDPHTQSMKLTATEENTYYHFTKKCVEMKHPSFTTHMLHIPPDILAKLTVRHKMQLHDEFAMEV